MPVLRHKFADHTPAADTEILIIGTYVPDRIDSPEFFYGWGKNYLWHLLPVAFDKDSYKDVPLSVKKDFMKEFKVDFVDVITTLDVPEGEEGNADDFFIDSHVDEWTDLKSVIDRLPNLKAVYFTRKTFNSIPNIRIQIVDAAKHCYEKGIRFCKLDTPSKYYDVTKEQFWRDTIVHQKTCLRP